VPYINPSAILIPATAVIENPTPYVWIVNKQSRITKRPVVIGARDTSTGRVEIKTGVFEGELVVDNPQPSFKEGQQIRK
jgi:hypothetical protein